MAKLSLDSNLSHYRIVSRISEGGMGEVYLAEDTQLHRKIALKVLPSVRHAAFFFRAVFLVRRPRSQTL